MKPLYYCFIAMITYLLTATTVLSQTVDIYPNQPVVNNPVVADIIYSPGDSIYEYEWLVNSQVVKLGRGMQSFRATYNEGFRPEASDSCIDSTVVELVPGWFGDAVHVGEGNVQLKYQNQNDISLDSGTVSFWIKFDYDIHDPIYDNWNAVFSYRIDDQNSLTLQVSQYSNSLIGTSQIDGSYESVGYNTDEFNFEAHKWYHYAWRWNANTGVQSLYVDGDKINQMDNYRRPLGEGDAFNVGSTIWPGSVNAFATIDEFRLFSEYLSSDEMKAVYLYPDKDIDAILEADEHELGDTIAFRYRRLNYGVWSDFEQSAEFIVGENQISVTDAIRDILLPGTQRDTFSIKTLVPCNCKTDTINVPYAQMQFDIDGAGTTLHSFNFEVEQDVPYSWIVKCAPAADLENPYLVSEHYNTRMIKEFSPDYPRLYNIFTWWNDNFEYIPRYDVVVTGHVPHKESLKARATNPDLKIIKTHPFSFGYEYEDLFREASNDTASPYYNFLFCDSKDSILDEEFWRHPIYNMTNKACCDFIAGKILKHWAEDLLTYDGYFFDRVHGGVSWLWDDMDIDRDGMPNEASKIDAAWKEGMEYTLAKIRKGAPNMLIIGNSAIPEYGEWLSGKWFEIFLSFYLEGWWDNYDERVLEYIGWGENHYGPWNLSMIAMGGSRDCFDMDEDCPQSILEETRTNYQTMRFGLATTLMGDGLYLYDIESPVWGQLWWYDEYDISLGQPTGPAQQGNFWRRDFEHGIALVNPYSDTVHIELEKTYWAFYGNQDPVTNNGQALTELKLPPKDGRILINYEPVGIENRMTDRNKNFRLYPNPARDYVIIDAEARGYVEIYSMQGQLLMTDNLTNTEQSIPVSKLKPGNYFVKLISQTNVSSEILIIE